MAHLSLEGEAYETDRIAHGPFGGDGMGYSPDQHNTSAKGNCNPWTFTTCTMT